MVIIKYNFFKIEISLILVLIQFQGSLGKVFVIAYAACCLTFWEGARILTYHTVKAMNDGQDVTDLVSRMASSTMEIGKGAITKAVPYVTDLTKSASSMVEVTVKKLIGEPQNRTSGSQNGSSTGGNNRNDGHRDGTNPDDQASER